MAPYYRADEEFAYPGDTGPDQRQDSISLVNPAVREYFATAVASEGDSLPKGQKYEGQKDDWRTKPELPTTEEILGSDESSTDIFLLPNNISGPWPSTELYLNAHYNLIREDAIAHLRDAVLYIRTYPEMKEDANICIYEKVFVAQMTLARRGIAFRLQFSTRRARNRIHWEYSPRLTAGEIVALSTAEDKFSTKCIVGVIAARPLINLAKSPPEVDIYFAHPEDIEFDPQQEWIMVEARSGYYECHRHTMTALQKLSREKFPLKQHICALETDIDAPEYISTSPIMDLRVLSPTTASGDTDFNVLADLPAAPMAGLNPQQWQALQKVLSRKIAIIQGPPGTGKTHVSVIALKLLLSNLALDDPPIIIATHTNHALDQLLSLVAQFEDNYIRLGGRSGNLDIRKRTLAEVRKSLPSMPCMPGGLSGPARRELEKLSTQIAKLLKPFDEEGISGPIKATTFAEYGLLTPEQCDSLKNVERWNSSTPMVDDTNYIVPWLDKQVKEMNRNYWIEEISYTEDDIDLEYEQLKELEAGQGPAEEEWQILKGRTLQFRTTYQGVEESFCSKKDIQQYLSTTDLMKIPVKARGPTYNFLRMELLKQVNAKLRTIAKTYKLHSERHRIGGWERDFEILRKAKLVAMTNTGLSKYRGLVSSLNPRTVLIEEAAEVLEAPTAVACFESIQQLILVGDHMQLKAKCHLNDLGGEPFFLDTSLFERLVRNDLPYVQLREQRRMSPEIQELLEPIYTGLYDHPSVVKRPHIPGMGNLRTFFFTHEWPESGDSLFSKINELEAAMIVEFYAYLVMSGVSVFDMTILTFYNGQRKLILKHMRTNPYLAGHIHNVVTVDSYQGEENEIVLLSLVRSNTNGGIGFLAVDNRVCVAMSRARRGFYIFGNSRALGEFSPLWDSIISIFENSSDTRIGNSLPLTCKNHRNKTLIRELRDWKTINGGCRKACGGKLVCGHQCTLTCHGFDHSWVTCHKRCGHVQRCCGVECKEICGRAHPHSCKCMSGRLNAIAITREASQGLNSRPSSANKTYQVASEPGDHIKLKRREISKNRQPKSSADLELLVDTRTPDSEDSRMGSLSLWEDFARSARAGMIDAVSVKGPRNVSSEDVQEGLENATERFIPLASKRSDQGSVIAPIGNDPVKPTLSKAPSFNQSPVPPTPTIADLIEFD